MLLFYQKIAIWATFWKMRVGRDVCFGSNFLPKIWPSHRLAVWLASKLAKHRSGVLVPTRAKQFARFRLQNKNSPQWGIFILAG